MFHFPDALRWSTDFCARRLASEIIAYLDVAAFSKHAAFSTLETR